MFLVILAERSKGSSPAAAGTEACRLLAADSFAARHVAGGDVVLSDEGVVAVVASAMTRPM
ncbi:MAG TPA: hypothetical protein VMS17_05865 [Gemmataceae bacterium]|nr:hypothetical protein [Gemmataceae bacterium]